MVAEAVVVFGAVEAAASAAAEAVVSAAAGFMAVVSGAAGLRSMAAGSEAVRSTAAAFVRHRCSGAAVIARRASSTAAAIATDIVTPITGRISITTGVTSIGAFYAPVYYGYPYYQGYRHRYCRVIWTYYGPRKICKYRPWRHHRYYGYRYW